MNQEVEDAVEMNVSTLLWDPDWATMAHEFGHGTGDLADEYCKPRTYVGAEPPNDNVTVNTNRATIKWNRFINSTTPISTGIGNCAGYSQGIKPVGWSDSQNVGLFEGGNTYDKRVYRPVINCRMKGNTPPYCPVCYSRLKSKMHPYTAHSFLKCYTGDFNGDGKDDLLIHNGNSIIVYRSDGSQLDLIFSVVERYRVRGSLNLTTNSILEISMEIVRMK